MPFPWKGYREWLAEEEELGQVLRIKTPIKCGDPNSIVDAVPENTKRESMRIYGTPGFIGKQMETELRATCRYLHTLPNNPIGIIENPVDNLPSVPLVINPWAARDRVLRMCGCKDKEELCRKLRELKTNLISPVVVAKKNAPVKEVVIPEEKIDLYKQAPRNWVEFEGMPWSGTGGFQTICSDLETGAHHFSEIRTCMFEWHDGDPDNPLPEERRKKYMGLTISRPERQATDIGKAYFRRYRLQNKPMPAVLAMCSDPAIAAVAISRQALIWPEEGIDEYAAVGGFRGAPIEVVKSETIPGLMVPAQAEWVFEGELLPEDYKTGKYGEAIYSGYMIGGLKPVVFRIKCITHRKDPLWANHWSESGFDHLSPHAAADDLICEAEAINYLRQNGYNVKDIVSYDLTLVIVQIDVDGLEKWWGAHYGKAVLNALYGCPNQFIGNCNKMYIVVGPDIDPYDLRDVIWALNTRWQPVSDSILIKEGRCTWADPSGVDRVYGEQMLIDALIKVPERRPEYPPRSEPRSWEEEAIKRIKEKIGA